MKHDKKYLSIYFFQLIFFSTLCASPSLNFRGNSSFLQVSSGATLKFNQAVSQFSGKLIKKSGATVSGSNITFVDGVLQDADNDLQLNAAEPYPFSRPASLLREIMSYLYTEDLITVLRKRIATLQVMK